MSLYLSIYLSLYIIYIYIYKPEASPATTPAAATSASRSPSGTRGRRGVVFMCGYCMIVDEIVEFYIIHILIKL